MTVSLLTDQVCPFCSRSESVWAAARAAMSENTREIIKDRQNCIVGISFDYRCKIIIANGKINGKG